MKKLLFIILGMLALNVVQAQVAVGKVTLSAHTKPGHLDTVLEKYINNAWKDFTPSAKDPAGSVVENRERINGYIAGQATRGEKFARLSNGVKAIHSMLKYYDTLDAGARKTVSGLEQVLAGVDLRLPEIVYYSPLKVAVEDYFQLKYIIEGVAAEDARGAMMFSTLVLTLGRDQDYKRYREILELGNDPLTLEYLECLKYVFTYNGYTKGLHELRPYIDKFMPEGKLKQELAEMYEFHYNFRDGLPAADFDLPTYDGQHYALKDFRGKVLVIDVWASWCSGCIKKLPDFMKMAKEYEGRKDIEFVSLSVDARMSEKVWRNVVVKHNLTGMKNFWADEKTSFKKDYNISGIPRYILIDKEGNNVTLYAPSPGKAFQELIDNTLNK